MMLRIGHSAKRFGSTNRFQNADCGIRLSAGRQGLQNAESRLRKQRSGARVMLGASHLPRPIKNVVAVQGFEPRTLRI